MGVKRWASGISRLLGATKLQSATGTDNPRYAAVWYQIPAPIISCTVLFQVRKWRARDWNDLWFNLPSAKIPAMIIAPPRRIYRLSRFQPCHVYFRRQKFSFQAYMAYTKNRRRKRCHKNEKIESKSLKKKMLKDSTFINVDMNMSSSGLQLEVAYWPAMTLGGAAHCPTDLGRRFLQRVSWLYHSYSDPILSATWGGRCIRYISHEASI